MSELNKREDLEFDGSVKVNSKGSAILGRITGPCADIVSATRNGRRYSEKLWQKVFADPIVNEYFSAGGIFGELNHPADREETDLEKVAICMPEPPKKNNEGKLIGTWDILNTPNGRIAKCLFDYGYKLGISSRGSGDTYTDYDGQESVDPESYTLQGFDLVYLPAVKAARLHVVNESLNTESKTLRKALNEALESATDEERKIMAETLNSLEIDYTPVNEVVEQTTPEKDDNIDEVSVTTEAAENNGAEELVAELQESLRKEQELESQIKNLQERLSVCYTKEARYSEVLRRTKESLAQATEQNNALVEKLQETEKQLEEKTTLLEQHNHEICACNSKIRTLQERLKKSENSSSSLNESINSKTNEISILKEQLSTQEVNFKKKEEQLNHRVSKLEESLKETEKDSKILQSQTAAKITQAKNLVEKYKNVAKIAIDKYIDSEAAKIGVSSDDIKSQLKEGYTFKDIAKVCESLQQYRLNINSLPFDITKKSSVRMALKESKPVVNPVHDSNRIDDEIDDTLKGFI